MWTDQAREDYRVLEQLRAHLAAALDEASNAHDAGRVRQIAQRQEEIAWRQQSIIHQMNAPGRRPVYQGPDSNFRPRYARLAESAGRTPADRHPGRHGRNGSRRDLDPDVTSPRRG